MTRAICVHGHFYQPPRENPWLETIELQDSAYPFHDWNERITAECYAPNAHARILDEDGLISRIVSTYERMSFNVGPTLLAWMADAAPDTYEAILESDRRGAERFGGHGPAIAQAYNHLIMPLANRRDKATQIRWGIADFEHRFGRRPEGMWLPETAVDTETLDLMAAEGIAFTILEPHQIAAVRPIGAEEWDDVIGGRVDPTMPYRVELAGGRSITVFVYDGPVSRGIAFEGLLDDGNRFADRLLGLLADTPRPQLATVATDGETYGHHHRRGEMALAYALERIDADPEVELMVYAQYLERHPPTHEAKIVDGTSWSCAHGVDRWRTDCGCSSGMHPGWHQRWREPLRAALDWLREQVTEPFARAAGALVDDPWEARDDYIRVILDRSHADAFCERHATVGLEEADRVRLLQLYELQRHAMLMYTSCGWFFDELSGIETVQVIHYAGRVIQLADKALGLDLEDGFRERLAEAPSNLHDDGRAIYDRWVRPARVDLLDVAAHYGLSSQFTEEPEVRAFRVDTHDRHQSTSGRASLGLGRITVTSRITTEAVEAAYGALHFGDHNLTGGVRRTRGTAAYRKMVDDVVGSFDTADLPETLRRLDRFFGSHPYSLGTMFRDDQRRIVSEILASTVDEAAEEMRTVYEDHAPLARFLVSIGVPVPDELRSAARVFHNHELRRLLTLPDLDPSEVADRFEEAGRLDLPLDTEGLAFTLARTVDEAVGRLEAEPESLEQLDRLAVLVDLARSSPLQVDLVDAQNRFYRLREEVFPEMAERTSARARRWVDRFRELGASLGVAVR